MNVHSNNSYRAQRKHHLKHIRSALLRDSTHAPFPSIVLSAEVLMFAFHVGNERSITFYSSTFHPSSLMTQLKIRSRYSHLLGALSRLRHDSFAARSTAAAPRAPLAPRLFDRYVVRLVLYVFGYEFSYFKIVRTFLG